MDLSAINPNAPRPVAAPSEDRTVPAIGTPAAATPQTADAVRQSATIPELTDRSADRRPGELTEDEQAMVRELKARDREVRAHEQAHKTVGGPYAGAISYDFQRGPDGQDYAIGGSVPIDTAPESTPEETAAKMQVVIRAALAPAEPSAQDRAVAAAAQAKLVEAQFEIATERAAERRGEDQDESNSLALNLYRQAEDEGEPSKISLEV